MEPNGWDPGRAAELVVRVIDAIDHSSDEQRDSLLRELLATAWGRLPAQNQ